MSLGTIPLFLPIISVGSIFSPTSISGMKLWIDSVTGVTGTLGGTITSITDQSGSGNTATSNGAPPLYNADVFGTGNPSIDLPLGGSDYLLFGHDNPAGDGELGITCPSGFSCFATFKTTNVKTTIAYDGNAPMPILGNTNSWIYSSFGLNGNQVEVRWFTDQWNVLTSVGLSLADGNVHTIACSVDSVTNTAVIWADGVQVGTHTATGSWSGYIGANALGISYAGDVFVGDVAEVMLWDGTINQTDVSKLRARSISKWHGTSTTAPAPSITSASPNTVSNISGQTITLNGTNFNSGGTLQVNRSGTTLTSVSFTFISSSQLTFTMPDVSAGSCDLLFVNPDNQTSGTTGNGALTSVTGTYSTGVAYRGINRAGAEYGDDWDGWTGQTYYDIPTSSELAAELTYLKGKGFNYIRLPLSWERIQHTLNGPLNTSYRDAYKALVDQCNAAGFRVCIDLHCYARYAVGTYTTDQGTTQSSAYVQHQIGDGTLTFAHLADVWTKIATVFSVYEANKVDYELMNEPHDLIMTSETFFSGVQTVINAIRAVDMTHMIMVPNTRGSDIDHWSEYSPGDLTLGNGNGGALDSVAALAITDSANNYCFAMHAYQDTKTGEWTTYADTVLNWAIANNKRLFFTEFGINNQLASGQTILTNFLTKLNNNSSVVFGWTPWNLSSGTANYNITASDNDLLHDGPAMPWYAANLTANIVP